MNGILAVWEGIADVVSWLWFYVFKPGTILLAMFALMLVLMIVAVALLAGLVAAAGTVFR